MTMKDLLKWVWTTIPFLIFFNEEKLNWHLKGIYIKCFKWSSVCPFDTCCACPMSFSERTNKFGSHFGSQLYVSETSVLRNCLPIRQYQDLPYLKVKKWATNYDTWLFGIAFRSLFSYVVQVQLKLTLLLWSCWKLKPAQQASLDIHNSVPVWRPTTDRQSVIQSGTVWS